MIEIKPLLFVLINGVKHFTNENKYESACLVLGVRKLCIHGEGGSFSTILCVRNL